MRPAKPPAERAREELERLGRLWSRERMAHRARFSEERARRSFAERVARGTALDGLEIEDTEAAPGDRLRLVVSYPKGIDPDDLALRPGAPVLLWWDTLEPATSVRAVIARRPGAQLTLVVDADAPDRLFEGSFRLDLEAPEATFDVGVRALARWKEVDGKSPLRALRDTLLAGEEPELERARARRVETFFDEHLNAPQREAVELALSGRVVSLVHGPPGTGKTRTLTEIVRQAVAAGERVLVCAASHTAVDNLAERLVAASIPLVRLGHPARVAEALEAMTLDAQVDASEEQALARQWSREAAQLRRKAARRSGIDRDARREMHREAWRLLKDARGHLRGAEKRIFERARVVCATLAGAAESRLDFEHFDRVVLDEATQALDPLALAALRRAPVAVLAGDPRQLPPTVIDTGVLSEGLGTTFFERLIDAPFGPEIGRMLLVQHRMHEAIMRFPSERLYEGRLVAAPEVATHRLEELGVRADATRDAPWIFLDTAGRGWDEERSDDDPSTKNPGEAERVVAEVKRLLRRGLAARDVAVITPYEAQARVIRGLLVEERREGLEVGTVDGFQGREKEAVVVDLVRSNERGEVGFLADVRRMNVAITRARRFLVVVGDGATLARHPFYAAFLEHAELEETHLSAWADDPDDELF
ncbi:MAG: AAA domain-containing protein [Polyangiales bacterium]